MRRFSSAALVTMVIVTRAWADPAELIKQKALGIRDQNNAQQGIVSPSRSTPNNSSPPATPSAPQGISSAQQQLLDQMQSDCAAIKPGASVTQDEKDALLKNMTTLAKGAVKPSKAVLTKLASDLAAAFAEKTIPAHDMTQLIKDVNIVMNCSLLTSYKAQSFVADAQQILKTAGVSDANSQAVAGDLKAIVTTIQQSKSKLYG